MDDYLDSMKFPKRSLNRLKELLHFLSLGGFKVTKFESNVPDLADRTDGSPQSIELKLLFQARRTQCTCLGLSRITTTILWLWAGVLTAHSKKLKKCLVLKLVSKIYDPNGLVSPFTARDRLLLLYVLSKDIWLLNEQIWDDDLTSDAVDRFLAWCIERPQLAKTTIQRSYFQQRSGILNSTCLLIARKTYSVLLVFFGFK